MIGRRTFNPSLSSRFAHHHEQIGVAGAFSVAIGGALRMCRAGSDGSDGVGYRAAGVVRQWIPSRPCTRERTSLTMRVIPEGSIPPLVSHHCRFGPGIEARTTDTA